MLLNVKPFMQPNPHKNPGGDCFACSLKVVVDYLYPEKPLSFDDAFSCFEDETGGCGIVDCGRKGKGNKFLSNHWSGFYRALQNLHDLDYRLDWEIDVIHPEVDKDRWSYSFGWQVNEMEWHRRVDNWLRAGWIIVIEMSYESIVNLQPERKNKYFGTDHFAVVDGQREFWKEHPRKEDGAYTGASGKHETHVVCSGKGPYWIDTGDLHHYHGVNGFYAIRRAVERIHRDYSWNTDPDNQAKIID